MDNRPNIQQTSPKNKEARRTWMLYTGLATGMTFIFAARAVVMPDLGLPPWTAPMNYAAGLALGFVIGLIRCDDKRH
jgi:hypothetical protein